MNLILLLLSLVMIACILCNKLTSKIGIPMLLAFLAVGMLCGVDGILHIRFDNYAMTETLCTVALIFIIFYGGFGTKWSAAKPVAGKSVLLSTLGVFLTAFGVGVFCRFALHTSWMDGHSYGCSPRLYGCGIRVLHSPFQKAEPEIRDGIPAGSRKRQ